MTIINVGQMLSLKEGEVITGKDFADIIGAISRIGEGIGAQRPAATLRYMADMLDQLCMQAALDMRKWEAEHD